MDGLDFGTKEERDAADRVVRACSELNNAVAHANYIGVNCKVVDIADDWDRPSNLQVHRMERRVAILPSDNAR